MARFDRCGYEKRKRDHIPKDGMSGVEEVITYYECKRHDVGALCDYPARYCRFKHQEEEFRAFFEEVKLENEERLK